MSCWISVFATTAYIHVYVYLGRSLVLQSFWRRRLFLSRLYDDRKHFSYPVPLLSSYSSFKCVQGHYNNQKHNMSALNT